MILHTKATWMGLACACALGAGCATFQKPPMASKNADEAKQQVAAAGKASAKLTNKLAPGLKSADDLKAAKAAKKNASEVAASKPAPSAASPKLRMAYAQMQEKQGNLPEARSAYTQLLAEDRKSVEALIGMARVDQLAGHTTDAEQGYLKAIKVAPKSPVANCALGQFYSDQKKWDQSVAAFQSAVQSTPNNIECRHQLAVALAKSGKIEQSLPHFAKTVGEAEAHYNVGLLLHDKGDLAAAETHFLAAATQNPQLSQVQYWLDEIRREKQLRGLIAQGPGAGSTANSGSTVSQVAANSGSLPAASEARITASTAPATLQSATSSGFVPVVTSGWQSERQTGEEVLQSFEPPPYPGRSSANGSRPQVQQPIGLTPSPIQAPGFRQPTFPSPNTNPYAHTSAGNSSSNSNAASSPTAAQLEQWQNQRAGQ
jgi:tetratricopeptide (TPR) repeat protein